MQLLSLILSVNPLCMFVKQVTRLHVCMNGKLWHGIKTCA